jgi:hypothetical protein
MNTRTLTTHQLLLARALVEAGGNLHEPVARTQVYRTARSLARRFAITVTVETKLPGLRFSYGYRAVRLTCNANTLAQLQAELARALAPAPTTRELTDADVDRDAKACVEACLDYWTNRGRF